MQSRVKKAVLGYTIILIALFAIIAYFYYFTSPLIMFFDGNNLHLVNKSSLTLKNVEIVADNMPIGFFSEINPGEKVSVLLPYERRFLVAEAHIPFMKRVVKKMNFFKPAGRYLSEKFGCERDKNKLNCTLEICNESRSLVEILIEEKHSTKAFAEKNRSDSFFIGSKKCKKIKYILTPLKKGEHELKFKIISGIAEYIFKEHVKW